MGWGHEEARTKKSVYDADDDTFVDAAEGLRETGGPTTLAIGAVGDGEVLRRNASTAVGIARAGIDTDSVTHIASDGTDHANVVLNDTHRASNGTDHANVVTNDAHVAGDGSDHADVATNTTHSSGDGSDHADVATNSAARHTQGTDQGLDTGGANAVTAAQAKAASDHVSADGSSHADVATNSTHVAGDGSDHADVATNTTHSSGNGSDHADVATNTTHAADTANPHATDIENLGAGTLAELNDAISNTTLTPFVVELDLSGTHDWQAGGVGSQDTTSGLTSYGDVGDMTTLEVGAGVISFDLTGDNATDKKCWLSLPMATFGLPDLRDASSISIRADIDLSALDVAVADTGLYFFITDQDLHTVGPAERAMVALRSAPPNRKVRIQRQIDAGLTTVDSGNWANYLNAGRLRMTDTPGDMTGGGFEATGSTEVDCTRIQADAWHSEAGHADAPFLTIHFRADTNVAGQQIAGTISALRVTIV